MKLCDARFHSRFVQNSEENHASRAFPYVQKPQSRSLCLSLSLRHGCLRLLSFFVLQFLAAEAIQYVTDLFAFDTSFFGNNFSDFFLSFLSVFFGGRGWREVCLVLLFPRRSKERAALCVPGCVCCRSIWFVLVLVLFSCCSRYLLLSFESFAAFCVLLVVFVLFFYVFFLLLLL